MSLSLEEIIKRPVKNFRVNQNAFHIFFFNGLAMISTHRNIKIKADEVIDELASNPRKLDFVL